MKLACYKGNRPGIAGLFNRAVRWWLGGKYSHTELVFSDGYSGSSSWLDGGVRLKKIDFDPAKWDLFDIGTDAMEAFALHWFLTNQGAKFDLLGLLGFIWRRGTRDNGKWFCSASVAAALGYEESYRIDPCLLPIILK